MEQEERQRLQDVLQKIEDALHAIDDAVKQRKKAIHQNKVYLQENKAGMDHAEKVSVRESVSNMAMIGEAAVDKKKRLMRLQDIPYFGRFDFIDADNNETKEVYVGVHNFLDERENENLIYDWRAPISSMFYDFELGEAHYESNNGTVEGHIDLKRQFRIRNGRLEYALESAMHIHDEVLQRELNQASSDKMRNIVATIQREQNAIIRNERARELIIQGVAGSGKTSIALHRIAFLLYRFKDTISSEDILIISPNKVFASYISNVLPELGEESVDEMSMEELADQLLEHKIKFQSSFEQVAELLDSHDEKQIERIRFKSSPELLKKMNEYLLHLENNEFQPEDIFIKRNLVPKWYVREKFQQYGRLPLLKRFNEMVGDIVNNVWFYYKYEITGKERTELHKTVRNMFPSTNLRVLYKNFYHWLGRPELLKQRKGQVYEYADVFPLIYLKMHLEGIKPFSRVKHLVVDEMQDYSAVQYRVLAKLFPCQKTILGDINQSVNPFSSSNAQTIEGMFSEAESMTMRKSYRSTYEIINFNRRISQEVEVEPVERHGDEPVIHSFESEEDEVAFIRQQVEQFSASSDNALGIICKTQEQANELYEKIEDAGERVHLLDALSVAFKSGVVITTAHLAKGLEFDHVIVPFCNEDNYNTEPDRQMLYVACTRAMHRLHLTHSGELTEFLEE